MSACVNFKLHQINLNWKAKRHLFHGPGQKHESNDSVALDLLTLPASNDRKKGPSLVVLRFAMQRFEIERWTSRR